METQLKMRTKKIGLKMIQLVDQMPNKSSSWVIAKQLLRCATSIGANYRAACRAKSTADFIYKLKIVEEEADETIFWLELAEESFILTSSQVNNVKKETNEILAIVVASIKTMRKKTI